MSLGATAVVAVAAVHTRLLLGCANLHRADLHMIPERHAVGTSPALCSVPAGLACAYMQSLRVHLDPNLQSVYASLVLYLQAQHWPQLEDSILLLP